MGKGPPAPRGPRRSLSIPPPPCAPIWPPGNSKCPEAQACWPPSPLSPEGAVLGPGPLPGSLPAPLLCRHPRARAQPWRGALGPLMCQVRRSLDAHQEPAPAVMGPRVAPSACFQAPRAQGQGLWQQWAGWVAGPLGTGVLRVMATPASEPAPALVVTLLLYLWLQGGGRGQHLNPLRQVELTPRPPHPGPPSLLARSPSEGPSQAAHGCLCLRRVNRVCSQRGPQKLPGTGVPPLSDAAFGSRGGILQTRA